MAASYTLLSDLKAGRCTNTAEVRLLRFWEARNINKAGELISVDMLLIDENSTLVQGSIGAIRQLRFRQRLTKGSVYTLMLCAAIPNTGYLMRLSLYSLVVAAGALSINNNL